MIKSSRHPDKKQLIEYILDIRNKDKSYIHDHLKECEDCRKLTASLRSILLKSENADIAPSKQITDKVFRHLNEQQNNKELTGIRSIRQIILRPSAVSLTVLCAVVIFFTYNYFKALPDSETISLSLLRNNGTILHEDKILQEKTFAVNSGLITTNKNSSATISLNTFFNINIAENTELLVESATKARIKDESIYKLNFELKAGNIFAEWKGHKIQKNITIKTRHADFQPIGTTFILSQTNDYTRLAVIEGRVKTSINESGNTFIIKSGEGFIINNKSRKISINTNIEVRNFNILFKKKNISSKNTVKSELKPEDKKNKNSIKNKEKTEKAIRDKARDDMKNEQKSMRRENRKLKKEMLKNLRSGKNSKH